MSRGEQPTVDHLGRPTNEAGEELRATGHDPTDRTFLESAASWFDERTGTAHLVRTTLRKVFPDHWSFLLGEVALFCFLILLATGTFLTFFFVPSGQPVIYSGPYAPLQGASVSAAFDSVIHLSFEVRAGLLMRQVHHWTAVIFVAVIVAHLARVFFTGGFRRPRELNWLLGFGLLLFAIAEGITGYSLPDDLLSGTGARIFYSATLSIPFVGPYVASLAFGGQFPTDGVHLPVLRAPRDAAAGRCSSRPSPPTSGSCSSRSTPSTAARSSARTTWSGRHFWPGQAFLSGGLFFLTAAVMALMGGLVQINPIWSYGPFEPSVVSSPAQPDWYVGWLDGALRIWPPFEPTILGITLPSVFLPGIVLPGVLFTIVALWPLIDRKLTGDRGVHHLLDWPWEQPVRAAAGAAILTLFAVLTLAGGNDVSRCSSIWPSRPSRRSSRSWSSSCPSSSRSSRTPCAARGCAGPRPTSWCRTMRPPAIPRAAAAATHRATPASRCAARPTAGSRRSRREAACRRAGRDSATVAVALGGCLPTPATQEARAIAELYTILMAIAAIVALIVVGLATFMILRYRRRRGDDSLPPQDHGDLRFEAVWTILPIITIIGLLVLTVVTLQRVDAVVDERTRQRQGRCPGVPLGLAIRLSGTGHRGRGRHARRPGAGTSRSARAVQVTLTGNDVVHAFFVPQFLFKRDAIPGRLNVFGFTVDDGRHVPRPMRRVLRRRPLPDAVHRARGPARRVRRVAGGRPAREHGAVSDTPLSRPLPRPAASA